jgi:hypothetical protein
VISVRSDENPVLNPYMIELRNEFTEMKFARFFGYGGVREFVMEDTISIDIFDLDQEGNFSFNEGSTKLMINAENTFGVPIELDVSTFKAFNTGEFPDSADVYIFGEGNPSVISLNYPQSDQVGTTAYTLVESDQSNLHEVLEISPNLLFVNVKGILNPENDPTINNFILDTSRIKTSLSMELQLFGSANGFVVRDTVDYDPGDLDGFEYLILGTNIENDFPISAMVQIEFADSLNNILFSLIPENEQLINAATVGGPPDYIVTEPASKILEIPVSKAEIDTLNMADKIFITGRLSTEGNETVKIYSDYQLYIRMGAKLGIKY